MVRKCKIGCKIHSNMFVMQNKIADVCFPTFSDM